MTSAQPTQLALGHALLLELIRSDLATDEERREARAVLEVLATRRDDVDLRLIVAPEEVDQAQIVEDNGVEDSTEGDDR